MVLFNYSTRELTAKIVYYGPGLCGKTTNLQYIHENLPETVKGKMLSLATKTDRTLFFDFLPIDLGEIRGMKTRVQLYTVPGQVFYNETRKLVLKGADGIVFVADSQEQMLGANVESFKNLEENLKAHGMRLADMPHVIQFNKRDLPKLSSIEDLNTALNRFNAPFYESVATTGIGVQDSLKAIVKLVLLHLTKKYDPKSVAAQPVVSPPAPAPALAAAPPAPSRPSIPRPAIPPAPAPGGPPSAGRGGSIPVSTMPDPFPSRPTARMAAAAPPAATAVSAAPLPAEFDDAEIDSLMSEVDEAPAPLVAPPEPAWSAAEEESVWMGSPDEDAIMSRTSPDAIEEAYEEQAEEQADEPPVPEIPAREPIAAIPVVFEPLAFEPEAAEEEPLRLEPVLEDEPAADTPVSAWSAAAASGGPIFEIDRGFDPEWGTDADEPPALAPSARAPEPDATIPLSTPLDFESFPDEPSPLPVASASVADEPPSPAAEHVPPADPIDDRSIVLSEVVDDAALFDDPTLEIAKLVPDEAREIVVPVQLGEGAAVKRYKLSIRLRLDPVD